MSLLLNSGGTPAASPFKAQEEGRPRLRGQRGFIEDAPAILLTTLAVVAASPFVGGDDSHPSKRTARAVVDDAAALTFTSSASAPFANDGDIRAASRRIQQRQDDASSPLLTAFTTRSPFFEENVRQGSRTRPQRPDDVSASTFAQSATVAVFADSGDIQPSIRRIARRFDDAPGLTLTAVVISAPFVGADDGRPIRRTYVVRADDQQTMLPGWPAAPFFDADSPRQQRRPLLAGRDEQQVKSLLLLDSGLPFTGEDQGRPRRAQAPTRFDEKGALLPGSPAAPFQSSSDDRPVQKRVSLRWDDPSSFSTFRSPPLIAPDERQTLQRRPARPNEDAQMSPFHRMPPFRGQDERPRASAKRAVAPVVEGAAFLGIYAVSPRFYQEDVVRGYMRRGQSLSRQDDGSATTTLDPTTGGAFITEWKRTWHVRKGRR